MDSLNSKERAEYCRSHGIPRERQVQRHGVADAPHPSRGGSRGYPTSERQRLLDLWKKDEALVPQSMLSSLKRWDERLYPHEMTGGKATTAMRGHHRFLLAFFKKFYPQARASHCSVFIALHSSDNRVFTDNEISKALSDMGMTRKRASTTAYQAFTPKNLRRHDMFWNRPFPGGIANVERRDLLDADEMAIEVKDASENYGHAVKNCRVRKTGNYGRGHFKITLRMAIEPGDPDIPSGEEGSLDLPRIYYHLSTDTGTTTVSYVDFLQLDVMAKFRENERQRTILHDNLTSHKSDEVASTVYAAGHRVKCRPPYRPHEAPIEYAFDQLGCEIRRRWERISTEKELINNVHDILHTRKGMGGFNELFIRCGYVYTGEEEQGDEEDSM